MGKCRNDSVGIFELSHNRADNSGALFLQFLLPIICPLVRSSVLILVVAAVVLAISSGCPLLFLKGFLLFKSKQFEILIIELTGMVMFDLFAIGQSNGPQFEFLVIAIGIGIVLAILLLSGCRLLDAPGVFVGIMSVRVFLQDFCL